MTAHRRLVATSALAPVFALALLSPAGLGARPMTAEDVARLESAGNIAVAPDGSRIAYARVHLPDILEGEENGVTMRQLFLADGPDQTRAFLPESMNVSNVRFSPDGGMIGFVWTDENEGEDAKAAVWGIPTDGGAQRKLGAIEGAAVRGFAFAPGGERLVMLAAAAPEEARDAEDEAGFDAIVYEEEQLFNRLFIAQMPGADGTIDEAPHEVVIPGYVDQIEVEPGGEWVLVTSAPSPLVDDSYTARRAQIVSLASGEVLRVIETPGKLGDVEIAPDGEQLSMIAAVDANDPADTTLHLVDVSTGELRALNAGAPEAAVDAEWMADGRLAAIIHVGAESVLRFYTERGQMEREVDPGALILTSLAQGGNRLAALADSPTHPSELFLLRGDGFERWSQSNPWLAEITFGEQRALTYTARDGQQVEGILIEPVGGAPAGGAPTILAVHGGPEAHDSDGWLTSYSDPGQVGAGAGYAVFYPNYRGSTAYGTAFSRQHQGDAAGKEFDDLVDAKRALVEMGVADPARVGVTGGSYGGYATAWSSTRYSDEFAAGVMFVGISNILSKYGTTDIPTEEYLVHARAYPWEDYMDALERSPIYYAGDATTPLLILHGADDPRVSPTQSLELYRNIKVRRPETPVRLVLYPGEGHGNRNAAARLDYTYRMMRWFETYLMSGDRSAALPPSRPVLPAGFVADDETEGE